LFWTGLAALVAAGFLVAKVHSDRVASPIAPARPGIVRVIGWVADIATPAEKGARLLIAPVRIVDRAAAETPGRVRIIVPAPGGPETVPPPGSAIQIDTLLDPPPGPASPGAYDFARDAWFEGIGGVGLAMRPPVATTLPPPPWRLRLEMAVNALRWRVAERLVHDIRGVMGPDDGGAAGLAAAVTTSHQDWLESAHRDDLRASGLAHMLAIAGLHTAAVSGFAFFAFRLAIAAWPWLALRVNGKKVAATAALLAVAGYLVLSGAHPPARRAAITAAVAFFAILVDRRAVSLHSLAVAALVILLIEPDVVVQPGFEMSFCATASLVALAGIWRRPPRAQGLPWWLAAMQSARDIVLGLIVVSLVAGAATSPFAIQHFNRVASYGALANLTADFVASAAMMPALALALLGELLGLGQLVGLPALAVAGWSARTIDWLGHLFATAPGAAMSWPSAPEIALAVSYLGIVFACLWKGRLRWIGVPLAASVALWPRGPAPVAWIASDGADAAVVVAGEEVALKPGKRSYATELWAQRRGFTLPIDPVGPQQRAFDCNRNACTPRPSVRPAIAAWWTRRKPNAERWTKLCAGPDILILRTDDPPPADCRAGLVLTKADFARGGSAEVYPAPGGWRLSWSQPARGRRPWTVNDIGG
ncbi:MAG: ComEC/Rec2 family competence protein, partial [Caulobacteraceae bacterium]|nr:ComEC/Rec2 family competence protein [Caulobacteraceae bacterium]